MYGIDFNFVFVCLSWFVFIVFLAPATTTTTTSYTSSAVTSNTNYPSSSYRSSVEERKYSSIVGTVEVVPEDERENELSFNRSTDQSPLRTNQSTLSSSMTSFPISSSLAQSPTRSTQTDGSLSRSTYDDTHAHQTKKSLKELFSFKGEKTTPKKKSMHVTVLSPKSPKSHRQENMTASPGSIHSPAKRIPLHQRNQNNSSLSRSTSEKTLPLEQNTIPPSTFAMHSQRAVQHKLAEELSAKAVLAHRRELQQRANANISQKRAPSAEPNTTIPTDRSARPHVHFNNPTDISQQIKQLSLNTSRSTSQLNQSTSRSSLNDAVNATFAKRHGIGGYRKSDPVSRYHQFKHGWEKNSFLANPKVRT